MSVEQKEDYYLRLMMRFQTNYVCLSFVSPDALIESKEAFKVAKFLSIGM